jgi:hypothetical protein
MAAAATATTCWSATAKPCGGHRTWAASTRKLEPGVYGVSNHLLDTPWPKVGAGKTALAAAIDDLPDDEALFELLRDDGIHPDDALPQTGVPLEWERLLSSAFVKSPGYGTRSSTLLCVDREGWIAFDEQTWLPGAQRGERLPLSGSKRAAHHGPVRNPGFHEFRAFLDETEAPVETRGLRLRVQCQVPHCALRPLPSATVPAWRDRHPCRASRPVPPCGRCARPAAGARCRWRCRRHRGPRTCRLVASCSSSSISRGTFCSSTNTDSRTSRAGSPQFVPVTGVDPEFDDIDRRVNRHQVEQLDDVVVAHAHTADRTRRAHGNRVRGCRADKCSGAWCRLRRGGCVPAPCPTARGCASGSSLVRERLPPVRVTRLRRSAGGV